MTMLHAKSHFVSGVTVVLALLADSAAFAAGPQNIVLLYADDMDWTDLPFYAPPVHWENAASPPTSVSDPQVREARIRTPDLNRSAARLLAESAGASSSNLGKDPIGPNLGALAVPADRNGLSATGYYIEAKYSGASNCANPATGSTCDPRRDILPDHGGLRRLALDGVVMPRMYSASARCAPARAALLTGRSQVRVGVPNNHAWLNAREITIAEFLKQGCNSADTTHACYRTALIGKWHLGEQGANSKQSPWKKGFDEFFGFGGGSRHYTSSNPLNCSPVSNPIPASGFPSMREAVEPATSRFCQIDPLAAGAPTCTTPGPCPGYPGLVCGPSLGYCFDPDLAGDACTHDAFSCSPLNGRARSCQEHWLYLGPEKWDACPNGEAGVNPSCCARNDEPPAIQGQTSNDDGKQPGVYSFKYKKVRAGGALRNVRFIRDEDSAADLCNRNHSVFLDDGQPNFEADLDPAFVGNEVGTCLYSERLWRDAAVNFIKRERKRIAAAPSSKPRRFFLMVAFHATHDAHVSPARNKKHYETLSNLSPAQPNAEYWGIIEELDAAVGTIMRTLDEEGLKSSTLVIFTNDHGSPNGGYGVPLLRGTKESVWEGGTRTGMLAYGPDLGVCDDGSCNGDSAPNRVDSTQGRARVVPHLGSQVDLFPTVADAAGLEDRLLTAPATEGGGLQFNACYFSGERSLSRPCVNDADCTHTEAGKNGTCTNVRGLDGRSLLQALKDGDDNNPAVPSYLPAIPDGQMTAPARDQMFARFPASGYPEITVVSRAGLFPDETAVRGTCGYERNAKTPSMGGGTTQLSGRTIQGASCRPCSSGGLDVVVDGATCGSQACEILGGVCFRQDEATTWIPQCSSGSAVKNDRDCSLETRPRCSSKDDCGSGNVCVQNVRVACESDYEAGTDAKCFAAGWKALGGSINQNADVTIAELFDMRTNPEEEKRCRQGSCGAAYDGELDCQLADTQQAKFTTVRDNLKNNLRCWNKCVTENVANYGVATAADRWTCDLRLAGATGGCPW